MESIGDHQMGTRDKQPILSGLKEQEGAVDGQQVQVGGRAEKGKVDEDLPTQPSLLSLT